MVIHMVHLSADRLHDAQAVEARRAGVPEFDA